jgi:hypothetical protein
MGCTNTK